MDAPTADDLRGISLFSGLDDGERSELAGWFETRQVDAGERLAAEGVSGYAFMVLGTATAEVAHDDRVVRTLGPGDFFGENAILGEGRRTATVRVTGPGTVWVLFGTHFREMTKRFPQVAEQLEKVSAERTD